MKLALDPSDWDIEFEIMADEIRQSGIRMVRLDLEVASRRKKVRLEGIIIRKLRKSIAMGIEETNEKCCNLFIFPFLLNNYSPIETKANRQAKKEVSKRVASSREGVRGETLTL